MNMKLKLAAALFAATLALSVKAQPVTNAIDNAGNYGSWGNYQSSSSQANSGTGLGNWTFANTAGGNQGENGSFVGGSGNINSGNGNAWGLYANSGQTANASTPFTAGALTAGQTLSLQMQNTSINSGGTVGFSLWNNFGQNVFEFYIIGFGSGNYNINVWQNAMTGNQIETGVNYTTGPLTLDFSMLAGNAWSFSIYEGNTLEQTLTSSVDGDLWSTISQARLFDYNSGGGNNVYFNNLEIVTAPEPTTGLLLASGLGVFYLIRRRR
jgi:hypothetical protein